ncbi:MAG: sulfurtransferase TusA family protein [Thermoplasmataceae archaeon]
MAEEVKPTKVIDARGSFCPGPLMELIKGYKQAKVGDVISLYSSDNGTKVDAPAWIKKSGNELIGVYDRDGYVEIVLKKVR